MSVFGDRVKKHRSLNNLSQKELGKRVNQSESAIGMYERGERNPSSFETTQKIAKVLGVSAAYLMGETNDPTPLDERKNDIEQSANVFFKNYDTLSEEDKQKALDYIKLLMLQAEIENNKDKKNK